MQSIKLLNEPVRKTDEGAYFESVAHLTYGDNEATTAYLYRDQEAVAPGLAITQGDLAPALLHTEEGIRPGERVYTHSAGSNTSITEQHLRLYAGQCGSDQTNAAMICGRSRECVRFRWTKNAEGIVVPSCDIWGDWKTIDAIAWAGGPDQSAGWQCPASSRILEAINAHTCVEITKRPSRGDSEDE